MPAQIQILQMMQNRLSVPVESETAEGRRRQEARSSLIKFTQFTFPRYDLNWHHEVLAERLERWIDTPGDRLIVVMPSRMGKTELVSRRLPAYLFGKYPDVEFMAASHSEELAATNNRDVQQIIDSPDYISLFPGTRLFGANVRTVASGTWLRNSSAFQIVGRAGSYKCAGVGGSLPGFGFDYGVIDDPFKDYAAAISPTVRESIWNWFTSVFYQRRNDRTGRVLITMTRWHADDLIGRLLALMKENPRATQWDLLRFSAEGKENAPAYDKRVKGEPLWPNRFNHEDLEQARVLTPPHQWAAMFDGVPTADGGNLVKSDWFRYFAAEESDVAEVDLPDPRSDTTVYLDATLGTRRTDGNGHSPNRWATRRVVTYVLKDIAEDGTLSSRRVLAEQCRIFQTIDTAQTVQQGSDYTVVLTWALTPAFDLLLLDVQRKQLEIPLQLGFILNQRSRWPGIVFQAVENKVSGIGLIQQAKLKGTPFRELEAKGNKAFRAGDVTAMYNSKKVFHLLGAPWLGEYEKELTDFPNGKHDDQWDAAAYAGILVRHDELLRLAVSTFAPYPQPSDLDEALRNDDGVITVGGHTIRVEDDKPWWSK